MKNMKFMLKNQVIEEIDRCIGCNACLSVCPVPYHDKVTIGELNHATWKYNSLSKNSREFALNCMQCKKCVPVCPMGNSRDRMMLWAKSKIDPQPKAYKKYTRSRGRDLSLLSKIGLAIYKKIKKKELEHLYEHVDKDKFRQAKTLLYFGCYCYSAPQSCMALERIMQHLQVDYEILTGTKHCCGIPHYTLGDIDSGEDLLRRLSNTLEEINPEEIITSCDECFFFLKKIKESRSSNFKIYTTSQWMLKNYDRLNISEPSQPDRVVYNDSCHLGRYFGDYSSPREVLQKSAQLIELQMHHEMSDCCGELSADYNATFQNQYRRDQLVEATEHDSSTLLLSCVGCLEKYLQSAQGINIHIKSIEEYIYEKIS